MEGSSKSCVFWYDTLHTYDGYQSWVRMARVFFIYKKTMLTQLNVTK